MPIRSLAPLVLVFGFSGQAAAEVKSVAANGFEVATTATIAAPPDRVYAALGEIGRWWSSSHTFSRDAANLRMELRAGGCFCEQLKDGGSVQHLQVIYAAPGIGLRLRGALGPLQMEGVDGTLSWALNRPRVAPTWCRVMSLAVTSAPAWSNGRPGSTGCSTSSCNG
jgi:hypothetical protein